MRTNQPWPFQLKRWKRDGIKTVVNLRGGMDGSFHLLERQACRRHGLKLVNFVVTSRDVPSGDDVLAARALFETIEYPAVMHCKSGADRAGIMSVLYMHFRQGKTGVLDYVFERYLADAEPHGISFIDWVCSDAYDPVAMKAEFRAKWWGTAITEGLVRRE